MLEDKKKEKSNVDFFPRSDESIEPFKIDFEYKFPQDIDPKIKIFLESSLSHDKIVDKLNSLSDEERKHLVNFKNELKLKTDDDVVSYFFKSLNKIAIPADRNILSYALMQKMDSLNKISYADEIKEFKIKCEKTSTPIYDLILDSLNSLWVKKYYKNEAYHVFEIAKEFENILFKDPRYRDHFIHQFQVFLSGLPIIENRYDMIKEVYSKKFGKTSTIDIEFSWLLAATFHDNGYLVQKFDKWLNSFFKEFLEIKKELPVKIDLYNLLLVRNFQEYIDKLTSLHSSWNEEPTKKWDYDGPHKIDNNIRILLIKKLIDERNHGVISSLILLDRIENSQVAKKSDQYRKRFFSSIVVPAGLSICLHDKDIFTAKEIKPIDFCKDPLSFTLIYCDTIQEWGRPISPFYFDYETSMPRLSEYKITDSQISATISYDKIIVYENGKTNFDYKEEELKKVFKKLRSNNPTFEVTLQSLDKEHEVPESNIKALR